jgi:hypothetical protein
MGSNESSICELHPSEIEVLKSYQNKQIDKFKETKYDGEKTLQEPTTPQNFFSNPFHHKKLSLFMKDCSPELLRLMFQEEKEIVTSSIYVIVAHDCIRDLVLQLIDVSSLQSDHLVAVCFSNDAIYPLLTTASSKKVRLVLDDKILLVQSPALKFVLVSSGMNRLSREFTEQWATGHFTTVARPLLNSHFVHTVIDATPYMKKVTKRKVTNRWKKKSTTATEMQSLRLPDDLPDHIYFSILSFTNMATWKNIGLVSKKYADLVERTVWRFFYHELTGTFERIEDESYLVLCGKCYKMMDIHWTHDKHPVILNPSLYTGNLAKTSEQIVSLLTGGQFYHRERPKLNLSFNLLSRIALSSDNLVYYSNAE